MILTDLHSQIVGFLHAQCAVHPAVCTVTSVVYSQRAICIQLCCVQLQYTKNVMICHICLQNLKHHWSFNPKSGTFSRFVKISEGPQLLHQGPNLSGPDLLGPNLPHQGQNLSQRQKVCDPICCQIGERPILLGPNLPRRRGGGRGGGHHQLLIYCSR